MAKIAIPKLPLPKLPKLPLPFLKRKQAAGADQQDASPEALSDEEAERIESGLVPPPRIVEKTPLGKRILGMVTGRVGQAAVLLLFLGGIGALGYWLQKHGDETLARRELSTPQEKISLVTKDEREARMAAAEEAAARAKAEAEARAAEEAARAESEETEAADSETETADAETDKAEEKAADGDEKGAEETQAADVKQQNGEQGDREGETAEGEAQEDAELARLNEAAEELGVRIDEGAGPVLIPELVEEGPQGPLPVPSAEGLQPWKAYSRPFNENDPRPRIAIIITNLGLSTSATEAAIQDLPGEVTLAFQPFASKLEEWIPLARVAGHEVMLAVPMEPTNFPDSDPGPKTLLTSLTHADNLDRLDWALSRFTGYVGVMNHLGGRFSTSEESLVPILTAVRNRGLLFVDTKPTNNSLATQVAETLQMVHAFNDRFIDDEPNRWSIDARLQELERIARRVGFAVGVGQAYPVTLERLRSWATTLPTRGLALAPITAVVDKQEVLN